VAPVPQQIPLELRVTPLGSNEALRLITALNTELAALYPEPGANHFRLDPDEVAPGRGIFVIGYVSGEAVACGAVRKLDAHTAEVKRMYVHPAARGRGYARRVLAYLEGAALRLGVNRLLLETGVRQLAAIALYRRCGFIDVERYTEYVDSPLSLCMGKDLAT